jgi:CDP-diglyceride synthetase
MKKYIRFGLMILTSTVIMYVLMYLNTYELSHVYFSETRVYMAIMMGAVMAIVMMLFMWKMYKNKKLNSIILTGSVVVFGLMLFLVRSQTTVNEVSWMRAMIPHHSIAILTSERANLEDERVQQLADEIIEAQVEEIAEMEALIEELQNEEDEDEGTPEDE